MVDFPCIQNADLKGKVVLIRVDHNVVKKGVIKDPYRIDASIETINFVIDNGGLPILMSHVGRPRNKKTGEIKISEQTSVEPIVEYLEDSFELDFKIAFDNVPDFNKNNYINYLKERKFDGLYLPNTRWFRGEETKSFTMAENLAELADIFVNDAFGSWQPHASTVEIAKLLPSYAGLLMQKEIENLKNIISPEKPLLAVVAGSKFDTKIEPLSALLKSADHLIIGGVIYNAYLCAKYGITIKGISNSDIESAQKFVEMAAKYPNKLIELPFVIESDSLDSNKNKKVININNLSKGDSLNYILDCAPKSFQIDEIKKVFTNANTIFVNAVMGFTPNFAEGTICLNEIISQNKKCRKYFGGGDTLQEFKTLLPDLYKSALQDDSYYFFTGGGTILKAIKEGSPYGLEPVKVLLK
ncbi:MAG: phosphoglycerate kinase [Candidatus Cloacimonadota bacterium]|nr:phosphoglycerate kinase [Candidatus Cloacimonadota bacterium]